MLVFLRRNEQTKKITSPSVFSPYSGGGFVDQSMLVVSSNACWKGPLRSGSMLVFPT